MHMLERKCAALADSNTKLAAKTADLEGRNRRNNIRIIGLPEFIKGPDLWPSFRICLLRYLNDRHYSLPPSWTGAGADCQAAPRRKTVGCHHPLSPLPNEGACHPRGPQTARQTSVPGEADPDLWRLHSLSPRAAHKILWSYVEPVQPGPEAIWVIPELGDIWASEFSKN